MKLKKITFKLALKNRETVEKEGYLYYCERSDRYLVAHEGLANDGIWMVSDYLTGMRVPTIKGRSRKEAIEYANAFMLLCKHNKATLNFNIMEEINSYENQLS